MNHARLHQLMGMRVPRKDQMSQLQTMYNLKQFRATPQLHRKWNQNQSQPSDSTSPVDPNQLEQCQLAVQSLRHVWNQNPMAPQMLTVNQSLMDQLCLTWLTSQDSTLAQ